MLTIDVFYDWGIKAIQVFNDFSAFLNKSLVQFLQEDVIDSFLGDIPFITDLVNGLLEKLLKFSNLANAPLVIIMLGGTIFLTVTITVMRSLGDLIGL